MNSIASFLDSALCTANALGSVVGSDMSLGEGSNRNSSGLGIEECGAQTTGLLDQLAAGCLAGRETADAYGKRQFLKEGRRIPEVLADCGGHVLVAGLVDLDTAQCCFHLVLVCEKKGTGLLVELDDELGSRFQPVLELGGGRYDQTQRGKFRW